MAESKDKDARSAAENSPTNADAQVAYAHALVQKISEPGIGFDQQAQLGMKIDSQYQKALKIDSQHWEARFSRAIGMTHWPSFMGGQAKAIKNFNVLIEQQEGRNPRPKYAATYTLLGNIYAQQGKDGEAKKVWERGAKLFPNDSDLKEALGPVRTRLTYTVATIRMQGISEVTRFFFRPWARFQLHRAIGKKLTHIRADLAQAA